MSGEVENLRSLLARVDVSAPSIQGAAAAMMKLYDRSSTVAVNEWRNQLQTCSTNQYIPLLYVANEVLQTSKRNRGTKFLEAFAPVLGPVLQFICDREPSLTEKVRRTVKIWGDRQVFGGRFITDLLHRMDTMNKPSSAPPTSATAAPLAKVEKTIKGSSPKDNSFDDDPMAGTRQDSDEEADEETSPFQTSGRSLLNVDNLVIDKDTVLKAAEKSKSAAVATFGMKRRRAQEASKLATSRLTGSSIPITGKKQRTEEGARSQDPFLPTSNKTSLTQPTLARRRSVLSTHNILDLLRQMADLNREYVHVQNTITALVDKKLLPQTGGDDTLDVEDVVEVGDELIQLNQDVHAAIHDVQRHKKTLFSTADQKKIADSELHKYLPFFKNSLKMDDQDIRLCETLERKLRLLQVIHADAKKERENKRQEETRRKAMMEEAARKALEEEERKQALQKTVEHMAKPKPKQIWNSLAREWQDPTDATCEDWRN